MLSWWPTTTTLSDSSVYARVAEWGPFDDVQHPAGYPLILAVIGALTREVAVPVLLQHLSGIASALLLFAATRRVARSAWAGLLPAAIVLLNPDLIFLEHAIMSESLSVLATSIGLYAAVRAFDDPVPWWRWPLVCGVALGLSVTIRSAGLFMIPVVVLGLLLVRRRPFRDWRLHWRAPVAAALAAGAILLAFASANASFGPRFGIGPSPGWYLYGRVAQFADCGRFDPPPGTEVLCEDRPAAARPGANYYLFDPGAPAPRYLGGFGANDDLLAEWSQAAIRAQPKDYLSSAWEYFRAYWSPGSRPPRELSGGGLDPQLDWTIGLQTDYPYYVDIQPSTEAGMEEFYADFSVNQDRPGLENLRALHQFTRFGGTALSIATVLMLIGLFTGDRRMRAGVLIFGVGAIALLVAPGLTGNYVGRYTVPMAGPMLAAAAIALTALVRGERARRRLEPEDPAAGAAA